MADLNYASPRPPPPARRSENATGAAWCAGIGGPGLVVVFLVFDVFGVPVPRWMEPLFLPIVIPSLAALSVGVFLAINSFVLCEPRWRLACAAGIACGAVLAWAVFLIATLD